MKTIMRFAGTIVVAAMITSPTWGQCTPDPGCVDINQPGEICPSRLPDGEVGVPYEHAITILPPDTAVVAGNTYIIAFIVVDSVRNLPPGISYTAYNDLYYPGTAYCIDIQGTPSVEGEFNLKIYITPYIKYGDGGLPGPQVKDDSSIVMTVNSPSNIDPYPSSRFRVMEPAPNPFNDMVKIGYYVPFDEPVELRVYNILGEEIYQESMFGMHGENSFDFTGENLNHGIYFYGIRHSSDWYSGKFIKMK